MTRLYGRAPRGQRLHAKVPYGHWKTMTVVAALRDDRIDAPCVLNAPVNGPRFLAWVRQFLLPTLKPGEIVLMDNLSSHKRKAVRQAISSVGAKPWFLPSYSPDLDPLRGSTPSSRSSPSSRANCARRQSAPLTEPANGSAACLISSPPRNAPPTSDTRAMVQPDTKTL
jgi:hypothetical protein